MEIQPPLSSHRSSVESTRVETAVMEVDAPQEEVGQRTFEDEAPIFREPQWSAEEPNSAADDFPRPVPIQPPARGDRMKQHDKDIVARLARGSTSSDSDSSISPDTRMPLAPPNEEDEDEQYEDQSRRTSRHGSLPVPPQPQQHRPPGQQRRPAPLTLTPTRPVSSHQPTRLPSLTRLIPTAPPGPVPLVSHHAHPQQDHRGFSHMAKQTINSPSTYGGFTPVHVVPSWQGIPYGWTPVSVPMHVPMQASMVSPHSIYPPLPQRMSSPQQQQQPSSASTATTTATSSWVPQLREDLWKVGAQYLCNPRSADAFVRAVEIRHGSNISLSASTPTSEDMMDADGSAECSPSSTPGIPSNPFGNSLLLRIVIHSPHRSSVAMTREFDRRKLRDTIPDFARSPKSPKSGTSTGTSSNNSVATAKTPTSAFSTSSFARRRKSQIRAQQAGAPNTPVSAGPTKRFAMPPVPIHLPFARAHAPALAAVLLLREMNKGDSIDLPVPYPGAWLETSGYMYTGNEELLTERVKQNLWYLGGVPTSSS